MESALVEYGRWLLVNVFGDDASQALAGRDRNPVWRSLVERAGGPSLRISVKLLEVAVRIAAHDKRINDDAWRLLEPGRKELLLPLRDEGSMREAAQRVVAMKMSHRATRRFVRERLEGAGRASAPRTTPKRLGRDLAKLNERLGDIASKRRLNALVTSGTDEERKALHTELARLAEWVHTMRRALRGN